MGDSRLVRNMTDMLKNGRGIGWLDEYEIMKRVLSLEMMVNLYTNGI